MPIIGISDRGMAFPELGRIRKGAPKPEQGNKPGADLTYFRFDIDERVRDAVEPILLEAFGSDPQAIDILLPFNTVDENFDAWREAYLGGGMVHRCDGEKVWYELDVNSGAPRIMGGEPHTTHDPKVPILTYKKQNGDEADLYCKPHGRLKVIVPQLKRGAFLTVITNSIYDCINISQQLRAIEELNGKLSGIPLVLSRRPVEISAPYGSGVTKRTRITKWLLAVEVNPRWMEAKLMEMERDQYAMLTNAPLQLVSSDIEDENGSDESDLNEDFDEVVVDASEPETTSWPAADVDRLEASLIKNKLLKEGVARKHTIMFLNLSPFGPGVPLKDMLGWARKYRDHREDHEPQEAARRANEDWFEGNPDPEVSDE